MKKLMVRKVKEYIKRQFSKIHDYLIKDKIVKETLFSSNTTTYKMLRGFNVLFSFLIWIPVVGSFWSLNLPHFLGYMMAAVAVYSTWIFEWVTKSTILEELRTITIAQITAHSLFGMYFEFYNNYEYYDDILHITGGMWLAMIVFPIILGTELTFSRQKLNSLVWKINIFTFSIAITLGTMWEIGEFLSDQIFWSYPGYRLAQENSLYDTMTDLIYDASGAVFGIMLFWNIIRSLNKNRNMLLLLESIGKALRNFVNMK
ncbi:MAG TPA: hypothetical protein PLS66_09885 [Tepiditoga sp.]|nr:hypothetical protein [Tepiditoga sp.]